MQQPLAAAPRFALAALRLRSPRMRLYLLAGLLALLAALALAIDLPTARLIRDEGLPSWIHHLLQKAEVFAHGMGIALILLSALALDPAGRRMIPRVFVCAYGSGLLASGAKLLLGRVRPRKSELPENVLDTFAGWLPALSAETWKDAFDDAIMSFPSGHTASAAGLAAALAWRYPHARWLFILLTVMAGMERVVSQAHFISDTLFGAALALAFSAALLDDRGLGRLFAWIEQPRYRAGEPLAATTAGN